MLAGVETASLLASSLLAGISSGTIVDKRRLLTNLSCMKLLPNRPRRATERRHLILASQPARSSFLVRAERLRRRLTRRRTRFLRPPKGLLRARNNRLRPRKGLVRLIINFVRPSNTARFLPNSLLRAFSGFLLILINFLRRFGTSRTLLFLTRRR